MSPLPHQISSTPFSMAPTATPAVRPFSIHSGSKVVTDSAQRKLDRKRANARIRQQRCRARKRARALEEEAKSFEANSNKKLPDQPKQLLQPLKKPEESASAANGKSKALVLAASTGGRYWQPPPPPHPAFRKPMTKNIHKLAKVPPSIASANAWKPPPSSSQNNAASYPAASAAYYAHHHAYGMPWYGAWSQQAAAAAYYNRAMHVPNHHTGYPPHAPHHHPGMNTGGLAPKLPPTSPLLLSPTPNQTKTPPTDATTPYHEVEEIVKSPMRGALTDVVSTPVINNDKRDIMSSPDTDLLPPLWSTCTKPTPPAAYAPQSPWSDHLSSPSHLMMASTPAPDADWNFSSLGYHDTPCLPTTTPVKTSSEIDAWHATPSVV